MVVHLPVDSQLKLIGLVCDKYLYYLLVFYWTACIRFSQVLVTEKDDGF